MCSCNHTVSRTLKDHILLLVFAICIIALKFVTKYQGALKNDFVIHKVLVPLLALHAQHNWNCECFCAWDKLLVYIQYTIYVS